jgi:DNA-binding LacI/PurR family transcriptional regulator
VGATLQTIADELGVSRSTVSNAYSRPDQLSPELRSRILETAERLGYSGPNPSARSLRRGRVGALGVVITDNLAMAFTDPYAVGYLRGIAEAAEERESSLLLMPMQRDTEAAVRTVRSAAVDAFCIYCLPNWHPAIDAIRARGLPVCINDSPDNLGPQDMFVGINEREAAATIGEHVANLGHRRIAIVVDGVHDGPITTPVHDMKPEELGYYVTGERVRGFNDAFEAAGIPWANIDLIHTATNSRTAGADAAAFALDQRDPATAIVAGSDVLALGVLDALKVRGRRPARDVSVTGFDDVPEAATAGLTTLRQPSVERGRLVGELLLDPPEDPARRRRVMPVSLVVRATTGPVPADKQEER